MDFRLLVLVDKDVHDDLPFVGEVVFLYDVHVYVLEALAVKILLDKGLGAVYHIRRDLEAFLETAQPAVQFLPLAFLYTVISDFRDAGALLQADVQPDTVFFRFGCQYLYVGKQPVLPKAFRRRRYLIAGHGYHISHRQTRKADQRIILIYRRVDARNLNPCNRIFLRCQRI
ncbi:hypothetical protein Barb7_02466 [Bacteroidales bacterium Barb7]|nr:hypothetical protein Barb7_02466 [Bacteroidales bacterium Barb7]